jgi:hypothetical protein
VTEPTALRSHEEAVDDLSRHERCQEARVGWGVHEPDEPHHGVEQAGVQSAHIDGCHSGLAPRRKVAGLDLLQYGEAYEEQSAAAYEE